MAANNRPLSPHLQVYRLPITGVISITHRATGILLTLGLILLVYVLYAIAAGEAVYNSLQVFMSFWLCQWVYWGLIYALFFHVCHGVRHLLWDVGKTFARETLQRYALIELAASAVLVLITYFLL
jgi:succinate dehydrogenase / fumarate reductase, cytochrome b subunit